MAIRLGSPIVLSWSGGGRKRWEENHGMGTLIFWQLGSIIDDAQECLWDNLKEGRDGAVELCQGSGKRKLLKKAEPRVID